jgi:phospholipase C
MYWLTGTIDPDGVNGGPLLANKMIDGGFRWTTYAERLEKAGISWKAYQQQDNYGTNVLENFKTFIEAEKGSSLHNRGVVRGPEGQFEYDAMNDKLPAVSWIFPPSYQSEHPDYMPADGAAFVASKIDAIAANPEVWAKTVFILNYDENDGIFDHVLPPTPPPGTPHEFVRNWPIGAGYRVPCIIVSPWTAGGWVCSEPFDHTSPLRFLEKFTGVREDNISDWRRQTFGDMTSAFRFGDNASGQPSLPDTTGILEAALYETAHLPKPTLPGTNQTMPVQEEGERKRVPPDNK